MIDEIVWKTENSKDLLSICGENGKNLNFIQTLFDEKIVCYGNEIILVSNNKHKQLLFESFFCDLEKFIKTKDSITFDDIENIFFQNRDSKKVNYSLLKERKIFVKGNSIFPKNKNQSEYIQSLENYDITFAIGPAGTGKTYIAVAHALQEVLSKKKKKLVLTRPVVEAGENLGFLPGDLENKIAPYLRPIYDIIESLLSSELIDKMIDNRVIEIAPLAYMRGRSLNDCYIILDEAQNTSKKQMKMFLTRLGNNSKMVITGDDSQSDLTKTKDTGLIHSQNILRNISEINTIFFKKDDIIRNRLVKKIVDAYEKE